MKRLLLWVAIVAVVMFATVRFAKDFQHRAEAAASGLAGDSVTP